MRSTSGIDSKKRLESNWSSKEATAAVVRTEFTCTRACARTRCRDPDRSHFFELDQDQPGELDAHFLKRRIVKVKPQRNHCWHAT